MSTRAWGGVGLSGPELSAPDDMDTPEYLNAYLNGMQFLLLAIEGRLEELDEESRETMREVLEEYHQMAVRMRNRARLGVSR
jgi:hypothetical protein